MPPKAPQQGHRILVIDDSEVMLARIKKALLADGHTVTTTAQTVGNARHLAACDLVIIDYHMPGIDGFAVQQQLRGAAAQLEKQPLFYLYTSDPSVVAPNGAFALSPSARPRRRRRALPKRPRPCRRLTGPSSSPITTLRAAPWATARPPAIW